MNDRAQGLNAWLNAQLTADATGEQLSSLATFLKLSVTTNSKATVPEAPPVKGEEPVEETEEEVKEEEIKEDKPEATPAPAPAPVKTVEPATTDPAAERARTLSAQ